jgi:hypothetical protein
METTWYGEQKVIKALDREFAYTEESHNAVVQAEWAHRILAEPSVTYPNGHDSHVVAGEVLDKAEDELIEFQLFH